MTKRPLLTSNIMRLFAQDREFQRFLQDIGGITTEVDTKANKVIGGTEDNIVILDPGGDIKDSGQSLTDVEARAFFFARIY